MLQEVTRIDVGRVTPRVDPLGAFLCRRVVVDDDLIDAENREGTAYTARRCDLLVSREGAGHVRAVVSWQLEGSLLADDTAGDGDRHGPVPAAGGCPESRGGLPRRLVPAILIRRWRLALLCLFLSILPQF